MIIRILLFLFLQNSFLLMNSGNTGGHGTLYSDNFNRANELVVTGWTEQETSGSDTFQVLNNVIENGGNKSGYLTYNISWQANQSSKLTLVSTQCCGGPCVRCSGTAAVFTGYTADYSTVNSRWELLLFNGITLADGVPSVLGSSAASAPSGDNILELTIIGTALNFYVDGTLRISVTNATIATGNAGIAQRFIAAVANFNRYDTWSGYDGYH